MKICSFFSFLLYTNICLSCQVNSEVYSSIAKMELLLKTQQIVINRLEILIKDKNITNEFLLDHLNRFKLEHQTALIDTSKYLGNPINSYRLIKRLTVDLKVIKESLKNYFTDIEINQSVTYPTQKDINGAAEGLLRLENVYELNKTQLAGGLWNTSYGKNKTVFLEAFNSMTIGDCYEIGKALHQEKYYSDGTEWLKVALKKLNDNFHQYPEDKKITLDDINRQIGYGIKRNNDFIKNFIEWYSETLLLMPKIIEKRIPKVLIGCFRQGFKPQEAIGCIEGDNRAATSLEMNFTDSGVNDIYYSLCRGQLVSQEKGYKDLKCHLAHGPHPFLKLAPVKVEYFNHDPVLILLHNIIYENEIKAIENDVRPILKRGEVHESYRLSNISKPFHTRVCQVGELSSNKSVVTARLRTRIFHFSGMNIDNSENLQVINYGIGGHYSPHYDYWSQNINPEDGNRIATVLFFMSDVEQGGATVFPKLGKVVFPEKGAALFWVNLLPSGQGNPYTYHGACPVLRGSKWITTQWITLRGQELKTTLSAKWKIHSK